MAAMQDVVQIRQGRIDLSFHQVVGEVFAHVLRDPRLFDSASAVEVTVTSAPHIDAFESLQRGETDLLVGWFDGSHGAYLEPFQHDVVVVGQAASTPPVYSPYCIWGVPSYVPQSLVPDVASLANPQVAARFKAVKNQSGDECRIIQGIAPGAGISRFSREIIEKYRLDQQCWQFRNGTQQDCFGTFEQAVEREDWIVIPLWHPQYLHAQNKIRALNEPLGLLRPVDEARLVLRKDFLARLASAQQERLLTILGRVTLGNAAVTAMDKFVHVDKLSYRDAARKWIRANQDRVDSWFDDGHADVVARTKQVEQYALPGETILSDEHSYVIPVRAPSAAGAYSPFSVSTTSPRVIHTSFQLPFELDGSLKHRLAYVGPIRPSSHPTLAVNGVQTVSEAEGLAAVRLCALNLLAQLRDAADGDLSRVQLLRLEGYISTADADGHFVNVPRILDAASRLIRHALGPIQGNHARTALTLTGNPLNVPTMLGAVAELRW